MIPILGEEMIFCVLLGYWWMLKDHFRENRPGSGERP